MYKWIRVMVLKVGFKDHQQQHYLELVRNASSQVPSQTSQIGNSRSEAQKSALTNPPEDCDACSSLRTTGLEDEEPGWQERGVVLPLFCQCVWGGFEREPASLFIFTTVPKHWERWRRQKHPNLRTQKPKVMPLEILQECFLFTTNESDFVDFRKGPEATQSVKFYKLKQQQEKNKEVLWFDQGHIIS